jgi:hypothetical protein
MARKRQLGVALDDRLRTRLEALADKAGRSIADEIRQRLERTLEQDAIEAADPETSKLMAAIGRFAVIVRLDTGREWHKHAASHWVMRNTITGRLQRFRPEGERVFGPGELPSTRLVASDDPEAIGLSLEALDFHQPAVSKERLDAVAEQDRKEMLRVQTKGKGKRS